MQNSGNNFAGFWISFKNLQHVAAMKLCCIKGRPVHHITWYRFLTQQCCAKNRQKIASCNITLNMFGNVHKMIRNTQIASNHFFFAFLHSTRCHQTNEILFWRFKRIFRNLWLIFTKAKNMLINGIFAVLLVTKNSSVWHQNLQ